MSADREREALSWLYSFADQERGLGWNPAASADAQWNLPRVRALLERAGWPDRSLRVVLVAGTKGKGSSAALLASVLDAAGSRVGLFTKPHLQSYRERVRVGGAAIDGATLAERVAALRPLIDGLPGGPPTTFELTTVLAVAHFAERHCRFAVMEVGLGGRLDATNALESELSIITSIGRDHTAILGNTLGAIAREKAGILRRERPALIAPQRPAAATALA
ncbi:MAG: bifunctional folylpolyglutamate synthase/dihydrofolate synthase, partial [Candidatus Limnocylindria bacterium]